MLELEDFKYILVVGTTDYELINAPTGWKDESLIFFKRDIKYHSLFRSFTLPMSFPLEGAKILRSQYYQYGSEALVRFKVMQLNRDTFQYEQEYIGEIDFSEITDTRDTFECNVMSGGLERYIKAYENVDYEIPLEEDAVNVIVPGIGVNEFANSVTLAYNVINGNTYPAINLINNDLTSGLATARNTTINFIDVIDPDNWAFKSNTNGLNVRIFGNFLGSFIPSISGNHRVSASIVILSSDGTTTTKLSPIIYNETGNNNKDINVNFDYNIILNNNERVYYYIEVQYGMRLRSSEFNLSYSANLDDFTVKAYPAVTLLEKLLYKIYDNNPVAVNSYLLRSDKWSKLMITSGDGIRQLQGAKVKFSLRDFMQTIDSLLCVSFGINADSFSVEERASSYNNFLDTLSLGNAKDVKFETYTDELYTDINVGYDNEDYDKEDGRDEFNSGQSWRLPINRIASKPLDLVSIFRADSRGVEQIRVELLVPGNKTTDSKSDNDVFMFLCRQEGTVFRPITSFGFKSVSGVVSPTRTYNYDISPKQNLLRHQGFLKSMLNNLNGTRITFTSADKNADLETISLTDVRVKENEDIETDSLTGQYFIPIMATFISDYPRNIQAQILENPYGQVSFRFNGYTFKGFILEVGSDLSRNTEREFKLLLSVNNNLVNLIR